MAVRQRFGFPTGVARFEPKTSRLTGAPPPLRRESKSYTADSAVVAAVATAAEELDTLLVAGTGEVSAESVEARSKGLLAVQADVAPAATEMAAGNTTVGEFTAAYSGAPLGILVRPLG